ncbi:hypothetical protein GEMRC1_011971 [Eukaryota sp. GEM-RC1]
MDVHSLFKELCSGTSISSIPVVKKEESCDVFALNESVRHQLSRSRSSAEPPKKKDRIQEDVPVSDGDLIRSSLNIVVNDPDAPDPLISYSELSQFNVPDPLISTITSRFSHPTPVQRQVIPAIFQKRDLLGLAPTGSGKTLAYLIPLITMIQTKLEKKSKKKSEKSSIRALILVPTTELIVQVATEFESLSSLTVVSLSKNVLKAACVSRSLKGHVLVATPLSLLKLLENIPKLLKNVKLIVVDEADKLLERRFLEQFDGIMVNVPATCRKCLFSATLHESLNNFVNNILIVDPIRISVGHENSGNTRRQVELSFQIFSGESIFSPQFLENQPQLALFNSIKPPVLIFVESKDQARRLYKEVLLRGITSSVEVLHADRSKNSRIEILKRFRTGHTWALICTDVAARGLDLRSVQLVVNYDVPGTINYVHRVGRVGRGISSGKALTLIGNDDVDKAKQLSPLVCQAGGYVPDWLKS